jgi:hypothetical protein
VDSVSAVCFLTPIDDPAVLWHELEARGGPAQLKVALESPSPTPSPRDRRRIQCVQVRLRAVGGNALAWSLTMAVVVAIRREKLPCIS